jgi:nicotinamidase-related amidase
MNHSTTALLVIDVQQGLFNKTVRIYHAEALLENINALSNRAHQDGAPVIYIQHSNPKALAYGSPDWQLHPRLQPLEIDCIVHKQHGNAFEATELDGLLRPAGITRLVVTGLVTHGCVRLTCLGALELGYQVVLVADGHSSYSKQAAELIEEWNHKLSVEGVELIPAAEVGFSPVLS